MSPRVDFVCDIYQHPIIKEGEPQWPGQNIIDQRNGKTPEGILTYTSY